MAPHETPPPLLQVDNLSLTLRTAHGEVPALQGLSFQLARGQTLGLIGESGSGKSLTALALMGLLPEGARMSGQLRFGGQDLTQLDEAGWCALRGRRVAMVFQEPMSALNPMQPLARQIGEGLRLHRGLSASAARAEALRLLERVRLPQAQARLDAYPHQLSGGQRQRVLLAIALACGPELLIADEPTTALDVATQREVLDLIQALVREDGLALLLVSHDLGVMAHSVEQLAVMYAGRLVEQGPTDTVLRTPAHPYTQGLLAARPRLGLPRGTRLPTIPGRVPGLHEQPSGCAFAPRCAHAQPDCVATLPAMREQAQAHHLRCWHPLTPPRPTP